MWPFDKHSNLPGIEEHQDGQLIFTLTDEEKAEINGFSQILKDSSGETEQGTWYIRRDAHKAFTALALSSYGRSQMRVAEIAGKDTANRDLHLRNALAATSKAYSFHSLPIYMFDIGCILGMLGDTTSAQDAYKLFLESEQKFVPSDEDTVVLKQRDMGAALREARARISPGGTTATPKQISAEDLAGVLWTSTLLSPPDGVVEGIANGGIPKIERDRVEYELLFYRIFYIDFWLQEFGNGELHGPKALVVLDKYIAFCKEVTTSAGIADEGFLDMLEERSAAYDKAQALWMEGMDVEKSGKKRSPESVCPLHETLARFCGVEHPGPLFLLAFTLEMDRFSKDVLGLLPEYEIVCSPQEVADATAHMEEARRAAGNENKGNPPL